MAEKENIIEPTGLEGLEKTRKNTRDFFRTIANFPTEATGLIKAIRERSPGLGAGILDSMIGTYNFFQDTFGKGEKGRKINISMDDINDDPRLFQYLSKLSVDHNRYLESLPEDQKRWVRVSKKRDEEFSNYINYLMDKYDIKGGDLRTEFSVITDEEEKTLNTMQADLKDVNNLLKEEGISLYPYASHDTDPDNPGPESITFDSDYITKVRGEPDIKVVGDRFYNEGFTDVVSFPYLGDYGVDEDGKFRMIRSSAVRPFDDPGYEALAEKHPILKGPQMWEDFIAPEYSADPELFRSPGFKAGMAATMGPMLVKGGIKGAKYLGPKIGKLAKAAPWTAGIMTALQAGKAEAPTIVPEGVDVTPESIQKYGKILMEDTRG